MANCSYGPNGQIASDAQFTQAVRSKRFVGCVGKFNDIETNTLRAIDFLDAQNVKFYGAVGDGVTDDTLAIQEALGAGQCRIYFPAGVYATSAQLTYAGNDFTLEGCDATISLTSASAADRVLVLTGNDNAVKTLDFTSVNRQSYLLEIAGDDNLVDGVKGYFATKAAAVVTPIYNAGAILISSGTRNTISQSELYNINGWGAVFPDVTHTLFHQNYVHDNFGGLQPGSYSVITENNIENNNTSLIEAADGILTGFGKDRMVISNNKVSGSGEHGMYLRASHTTIEGNYVYDNQGNGIKIRDCTNTTVTGNTFENNNIPLGNLGELEIQASDQIDVDDVTISVNSFKSRVGSPLMSIKCSYFVGNPTAINRLTISGNVGEGISGGFDTDCVVSGNTMSSYIDIAVANTNAPAEMFRCMCTGNITATLTGTRARETTYSNNIVTEIQAMGLNNNFIGNRVMGQTTFSTLGSFSIFSDNYFYWNGAAIGTIFDQGAVQSRNFDKVFSNNIFENLQGTNLITFSSAGIAGDNILFAHNQGDSTARLFDIYGSGHRAFGNINTGGGTVGAFRATGNFASGNFPAIEMFAVNPNLRQITGWNTTVTGADETAVVPAVVGGAYVQAEVQAIAEVVNALKRDLIAQGLITA
jgi:parallel beta-helix repeat protein